MSEVVLGVIQKKDVGKQKTKYGDRDRVGIQINGAWYSAFVNKDNKAALDAVNENDSVKLTYDVNGEYKNLVAVEKVAESTPVVKATGETVTVRQAANDKDIRIAYAGSVEDAVPFVDMLLRNNALPAFNDRTKQADKADILEEAVHYYALQFTKRAFSITADDVKEQAEPEVKQAGAKQLSE